MGGFPLSSLQPIHIPNFYRQLEKKCSPRTRQLVHVVLKMALKQALKWNHISKNPCDLVSKPTVPKKSMKFWSANEISHFLETTKSDRLHALYVLALSTGLRQGELFGLQWSDLNASNLSISIQRTTYELSGHIYEGEPKTAKGRRKIDLPRFAMDALFKHKEAMTKEGHKSKWIFCDTQGNPLRRGNFRKRSFLKVLEKSGLPPIRFHDLRHSAATLLLSQGVHPKIVQERLGHSQISITLDIYSHVLPTLQKEAADKTDQVLMKGENDKKHTKKS